MASRVTEWDGMGHERFDKSCCRAAALSRWLMLLCPVAATLLAIGDDGDEDESYGIIIIFDVSNRDKSLWMKYESNKFIGHTYLFEVLILFIVIVVVVSGMTVIRICV
jgi:hypothetical protein